MGELQRVSLASARICVCTSQLGAAGGVGCLGGCGGGGDFGRGKLALGGAAFSRQWPVRWTLGPCIGLVGWVGDWRAGPSNAAGVVGAGGAAALLQAGAGNGDICPR